MSMQFVQQDIYTLFGQAAKDSHDPSMQLFFLELSVKVAHALGDPVVILNTEEYALPLIAAHSAQLEAAEKNK